MCALQALRNYERAHTNFIYIHNLYGENVNKKNTDKTMQPSAFYEFIVFSVLSTTYGTACSLRVWFFLWNFHFIFVVCLSLHETNIIQSRKNSNNNDSAILLSVTRLAPHTEGYTNDWMRQRLQSNIANNKLFTNSIKCNSFVFIWSFFFLLSFVSSFVIALFA